MPRLIRLLIMLMLVTAALPNFAQSAGQASNTNADAELLKARETVWRAWFVNDVKTLQELVPAETIVMSAGEAEWKNQADVLREAVDFQAQGGKLVRLEFPRTEVQHFGDVAIIWSKYVVETEMNGKATTSSGRVTEIFVRRNGRWTNPGWHTEHEK
jgi:ketosteroid isomerase-like protein